MQHRYLIAAALVVGLTTAGWADPPPPGPGEAAPEAARLRLELEDARRQTAVAQVELLRARRDAAVFRDEAQAERKRSEALNQELKARLVEAEALAAKLKALFDRTAEVVKSEAKLRDELTTAQIQVKSLLDRNQVLLERIKVLEARPAQPERAAPKQPPGPVEGRVTAVEAAKGLVRVSIGSDAGLEKGQTLEVYRLKPAVYLGRLRIVEVSPREAVGQREANVGGPIKEGDTVSDRINSP